jgi:hypothetical protein
MAARGMGDGRRLGSWSRAVGAPCLEALIRDAAATLRPWPWAWGHSTNASAAVSAALTTRDSADVRPCRA